MTPVQFLINGNPHQLLQPLPDVISSCAIQYNPSVRMLFNTQQSSAVKAWFNTLIDNLSADYVTFNGVIIASSDLNKFN